MTALSMLWLPILLSAVIVFIVSSIIHTVMPWHKTDFSRVPNEEQVMDALRPFAIPPGDYMMPRPASMADMRAPEFVEKMQKGPKMIFTMLPNGQTSMSGSLVLWFIYSLIIGLFAAYVTGRALPTGATYAQVFRFAGVTTFLAYSGALFQPSIWFGRSWSTTIKSTIDGLIYALLTAGTFGWLWPR